MTERTLQLDPDSRRLLETIARAADEAGVSWMITGAMARHLVFERLYGLRPGRFTRDWDIGIEVASWEGFQSLEAILVEGYEFQADRHQRQRLTDPHGSIVDLIPFGGVESEPGVIRWGEERAVRLNVSGFREAYKASLGITLDTGLTAKVASPPGLAILKVIAWQDRHRLHDRDAEDLAYLLENYARLVAGNLHDDYLDWMEEADYDEDAVGARVLGHKAATVAGTSLSEELRGVLDAGLRQGEDSRLVRALEKYMKGKDTERGRALLRAFRTGLAD
ncbi:nucleotidyl transferase AbiEii/AbiGii toxin family protein [Thiohalorhabdus methylotrophus]|uniref:Nucleotidyl transferase AbiEii/AbiGii toxin family protein n=1 Tax=Thiohalorhabdus methylotrophus TaxID=3242694 RepID=A0ABV4TSD6_9GAMM